MAVTHAGGYCRSFLCPGCILCSKDSSDPLYNFCKLKYQYLHEMYIFICTLVTNFSTFLCTSICNTPLPTHASYWAHVIWSFNYWFIPNTTFSMHIMLGENHVETGLLFSPCKNQVVICTKSMASHYSHQ